MRQIIAITFPANVRSNTYAVDYGRVLGPEWMARQVDLNMLDALPRGTYARLHNEWNLTDPTTDGRTFAQYVRSELAAAEAIRVAAFFVDPRNIIHTDLFARHAA